MKSAHLFTDQKIDEIKKCLQGELSRKDQKLLTFERKSAGFYILISASSFIPPNRSRLYFSIPTYTRIGTIELRETELRLHVFLGFDDVDNFIAVNTELYLKK